jgi:hypothetical protein
MTSSLLCRAACVAAVFFAPSAAHAFCRTTTVPVPASYSPTRGCFTEGKVLFWKGQCVSYSPQQDASAKIPFDTAKPIIDQAFATWTAVSCTGGTVGIAASSTDPVACSEVRYNQNGPNQNVVVFRDTTWPYNDPNNTLGLTTVTFNADTGEIYDADMEINETGDNLSVGDPVPPKGFDLLSVITHEAGHFFGLAHATSSSSTMFASYKPGTTSLRKLSADDIDGLCTIYPDASERTVDKAVSPTGIVPSDACDSTPRHGFGTTCAENPPPQQASGCSAAGGARPEGAAGRGSSAAALSLALALLVRRRHGRRGDKARVSRCGI